ncbi:hypothetical protein AVEN_146680-1 [Araneus ventricosus]|uniref:Reverse transcriptase domain-containing protein n=1 Tax=Araneus ventricosus TaxID=182803 RepID=A0A4Y2LCN6_ARAVE|nr:hypothetical protein AVEN_146680-1 [Araneus ventricosus]
MLPKPNQNRKLPGSYRPISLLSNIGKLYEKILLKRLTDHCHTNNIIPEEQFGIRKKHSCKHQLFRVTNKIVKGFKDYIIKIIERFLSNRKFLVKINQVLSTVGNIQAGTPQGSSLSPPPPSTIFSTLTSLATTKSSTASLSMIQPSSHRVAISDSLLKRSSPNYIALNISAPSEEWS